MIFIDMAIFRSMLHVFFPFSPVSLIELSSFWNGLKELFTLHTLADKVKILLSLTSKTDDVTSGKRNVDLHGRLWAAQERLG